MAGFDVANRPRSLDQHDPTDAPARWIDAILVSLVDAQGVALSLSQEAIVPVKIVTNNHVSAYNTALTALRTAIASAVVQCNVINGL
jgi:hypothetical protein